MTTTNGNSQKPHMGIRELLLNHTLLSRQEEIFRNLFDSRRSLESECGYPEGDPDAHYYQSLYDRDPIACRVVEVMPKESWQVQPVLYESEDAEEITVWEEALQDVDQGLRGEDSYYSYEETSCINEHLIEADIQSGIGRYGVILLGLDDGLDLAQPVRARKGQKLLFLRTFPESLADIVEFDPDINSPRFGQPVFYNLTLNDPRDQHGGTGLSTATVKVHWSRVHHVANKLVFGIPRMRPVLNRLLDLRKVYGADAESYWKNCMLKLMFETHPALGGDVQIDIDAFKDQVEEFGNGLQQWMTLMGMSAKPIAPAVADPTAHVNTQIEAICIQLGIPKRVFMGSERGELASSQDDAAWNDRLRQRQSGYITPRIIVPFVDRLIGLGVLPEPKDGYRVWWPDLASQTEQEKADIAAKYIDALSKYVGGSVESVLPPVDMFTRVLGWTDEEANQVMENAAALMEENAEEEMALEEERAAMAAEERAKLEQETGAVPEERAIPEPSVNVEPSEEEEPVANAWTPIADAFAVNHLPGKHDQASHGSWAKVRSKFARTQKKNSPESDLTTPNTKTTIEKVSQQGSDLGGKSMESKRMPSLVGSEKQVAWAEEIRSTAIPQGHAFEREMQDVAAGKADAKFWIDNRNTPGSALLAESVRGEAGQSGTQRSGRSLYGGSSSPAFEYAHTLYQVGKDKPSENSKERRRGVLTVAGAGVSAGLMPVSIASHLRRLGYSADEIASGLRRVYGEGERDDYPDANWTAIDAQLSSL